MAVKNITGMRSGKLVAIRPIGYIMRKDGRRNALWECKCDCGNYTKASSPEITQQRKKSCGCSRRKQEIIVTEEKEQKDIKVIKEHTEDFGEITVVVIGGECYFLFSEIDKVMQLGRRSRFMQYGYTKEAFWAVLGEHGWRIEEIPEIGEQLLINLPGVMVCYKWAKYSLYYWADDEGIGGEKEEEMKKQLEAFMSRISDLNHKHENSGAQWEKNLPIIKALWDVTGEPLLEAWEEILE